MLPLRGCPSFFEFGEAGIDVSDAMVARTARRPGIEDRSKGKDTLPAGGGNGARRAHFG